KMGAPGIDKIRIFSLGGTLEGGVLADTPIAKPWKTFLKKAAGTARGILGLEPKRAQEDLANAGATREMLDEIIPIRAAGVLATGDGERQGTRPAELDLAEQAVQLKGKAG